MTRARDVLYVAGVRLINVPKYTLVHGGAGRIGAEGR